MNIKSAKMMRVKRILSLFLVPVLLAALCGLCGCGGSEWQHCGIYHCDSGVGYALNMQNDKDGVYTMFSVIGEDVYSGYAKVKKDTAKVSVTQEINEENIISLEIRPLENGRLEVSVVSAPGYSALNSGDKLIMEPGMLLLPDDKAAIIDAENAAGNN